MSTDLFKFSFTQRSGVEATKGSQSFFAGQGQMSKVTACLSEEQCALPPQQMTQNTAAWSPGRPCMCGLSLPMELRGVSQTGDVPGPGCKLPAEQRPLLSLTNWMGLHYQISCQEASQSNVCLLLITKEWCYDSDTVSPVLKDRVNAQWPRNVSPMKLSRARQKRLLDPKRMHVWDTIQKTPILTRK